MNAGYRRPGIISGITAAVLMLAGSAWAAGERSFTTEVPCSTIKQAVDREGAVVLFTGPHLYDRYVTSQFYCPTMTRTRAAWVPARDTATCFVGYTCEPPNLTSPR